MIAAEADDEDIHTMRLVCSGWKTVTLPRFLPFFNQVAFRYTKAGLTSMLEACQHPVFGPHIQTLILIVDCKRRNASSYQQIYNQALVALRASGQSVCLGIRWCQIALGEVVTPELASGRLATLLDKKILPAGQAAGLVIDNLLIELPDARPLQDEPNTYQRLINWLNTMWWRHNQIGGPSKLTIRFDNSIAQLSRPPSFEITQNPARIECHGMLPCHYDAFYELFQLPHLELALHNCSIPETFFRETNHLLTTIILEGITIYSESAEGFRDIPVRPVFQGSASKLLSLLLGIHPGLSRLRLKNISQGDDTWLSDGPHLFDVRGAHKLPTALTRLLEGYRGWEIAYWCCGDEGLRDRMLMKWQGSEMGSGLL
ncbi:unnamed protein product [Aureobasidium mustum]|uniref:Uncharacterized protein n=1 Tax=Aureobasidium mustum TaxID=2773714 RepID=A0A9N8JRD7_9PEZI|nr:unnamed protein product [Aureobasidium mustum]